MKIVEEEFIKQNMENEIIKAASLAIKFRSTDGFTNFGNKVYPQ